MSEVKEKTVLEIGSVLGRTSEMLLQNGVEQVFPVEPSHEAFKSSGKEFS